MNEPVRECTIILTEMFSPDENHPRKIYGAVEFKTVALLGAYLSGRYNVAKSIGYNLKRRPKKVNERLIGRLSFHYIDKFASGTFEFDNVQEFVKFLDANPPLAKMVEYQKKGPDSLPEQ